MTSADSRTRSHVHGTDNLVEDMSPTSRGASTPNIYEEVSVFGGPGTRLIRVLRLDPALHEPGGPEPPLTATLDTVDLANSPKFTALSYVWGDSPGSTPTIAVRPGSPASAGTLSYIPITPSGLDALRHLRRQFGAITIWIDAICINQQDADEVKAQLPHMGEIYMWARTVYVWLGPASESVHEAFAAIREVAPYSRRMMVEVPSLYPNRGFLRALKLYTRFSADCTINFWSLVFYLAVHVWLSHWKRLRKLSRLSTTGRHAADGNAAASAGGFVAHTWTTRAWTFQELVLAWNITLVCGDESLSWETFIRGMDFIGRFHRTRTVFRDWQGLLDLWLRYPRPTRWNDIKMRYSSKGRPGHVSVRGPNVSAGVVLAAGLVRLLLIIINVCIFIWLFIFVPFTVLLTSPNVRQGRFDLFDSRNLGSFIVIMVLGLFSCVVSVLIIEYALGSRESTDEPSSADTFESTVGNLRARQCSNPHDKSYAFGAILENIGVQMPSVEADIDVGIYDRPLGDVYQELFCSLVRWDSRSVRLIMDAGIGVSGSLVGCPSWVPNLRQINRWLGPDYFTRPPTDAARSPIPHHHEFFPAREVNRESSTISLRVMRHSTVAVCHGPFSDLRWPTTPPNPSVARRQVAELLPWFQEIPQRVPAIDAYAGLRLAILTTLEARPPRARRSDNGEDSASFHSWEAAMRNAAAVSRRAEGRDGGPFIPEIISDAITQMSERDGGLEYLHKCHRRLATQRRGLFITSLGYLGSGPELIVEGDEVVLVEGIPVPMILRRSLQKSGSYQVVGAAFVHGLMHGEEWDWKRIESAVLV